MNDLLSPQAIEAELGQLDGWSVEEGKLHKTFKFQSFAEAFGFMTQVAIIAEKQDHHPDWSNVYNKVVVDLVSHDSKGITPRDISLARSMNQSAGVCDR